MVVSVSITLPKARSALLGEYMFTRLLLSLNVPVPEVVQVIEALFKVVASLFMYIPVEHIDASAPADNTGFAWIVRTSWSLITFVQGATDTALIVNKTLPFAISAGLGV